MIVGSALMRVAGISDVSEKNGLVTIRGVSAQRLHADMKKIWTTSKVASSIFVKVSRYEVSVPSFFALELRYILQTLLGHRGLMTSKRILNSVIDGINENTWVATTLATPMLDFDYSVLKEFIYDSLLPHQMEFLRRYQTTVPRYGLNGMLLSAAPGSGKTVSDCAIALLTKSTKVIIVCPKNAVYRVWQKTLNEEFKVPQNPFIHADGGPLEPKKKWHIFHYEGLDRALELAKSFYGEDVCIILDESHNFNEIKSLRTERFIKLCKVTASKHIIWASGTPVKAMGFETIPLLRTIDPLFNDVAENAFRRMFGRDAKRTLDILAYRLGLVTHATAKTVVMDDEPEFETINVKIPGGDKYTLEHLSKVMADFIQERTAYYNKNRAHYQQIFDQCIDIHRKTLKTKEELDEFKAYMETVNYMVKNGFDPRFNGDMAVMTNKYEKNKIHPSLPNELRKPFIDAKSVIKYVELKVRGECLGRILTKERIQCHIDMIKHIDFQGIIGNIKKKTLIFTSYVKVVDACFEHLKSLDYKPLRVYGDNNNELVSIVKKYGSDPQANPLVTTYQSLSTAVPLTMANGIIFLNNPWRSSEKEQAVARAHRIGQDQPVYCFDIILDTGSKANISSRSQDIMQWSKEQVDAIMGFEGNMDISMENNGFVEHSEGCDVNEIFEDVLWSDEITPPHIVDDSDIAEINAEIDGGYRVSV